MHTFEYNQSLGDYSSGYVYATRFTKDGNFIIAGGGGKNELKVFQNNSDTSGTYKIQMEFKDLPSPVTSIDTSCYKN